MHSRLGHITGPAVWLGTGQATPVTLERVGCFPRVGFDGATVPAFLATPLQSLEKAKSSPLCFCSLFPLTTSVS